MHVDAEAAAGLFCQSTEQGEDRVLTLIIARQRILARGTPRDVVGKQLT